MDNYDYEAINSLANSKGWELLCKELDIRIKSIESILLEPSEADMFNSIDDEKQKNLINYKKMERKYLISLKELPQSLLKTKITNC